MWAGMLFTWIVITIGMLVISKLPIGVEIDSFGKALIAAAVFGILNAVLKPIFLIFSLPLIVLTLGLFTFIVNAAVFAIAAALVDGFRLKFGIWSAILGSLLLSFCNVIVGNLLSQWFPAFAA